MEVYPNNKPLSYGGKTLGFRFIAGSEREIALCDKNGRILGSDSGRPCCCRVYRVVGRLRLSHLFANRACFSDTTMKDSGTLLE